MSRSPLFLLIHSRILRPQSLSVSAFGAPSLRAFGLVCLEGETIRGIVDDLLVALWAQLFLFPWGFVPITVVAIAAFAFVAAAAGAPAMVTATLGEWHNEFCILCHDFQYLLALFREFGLEKREGSKAGGMPP